MGKAKRRSFQNGINDKFPNMTRKSALDFVVENIEDKSKVIDLITLFDFSAEEILEAGATFEDVKALGGIVH